MKNQTSKTKIRLFLFASSLAVCLLAENTFAVEKITLQLNLKPGQKYKRVVTMEEGISQTIEGQQMDIAHTKIVGLEFEVKNIDVKGIASVKVTYRTLKENTSSVAGEFEYNSVNPITFAGNPLAPTYTAMMNESFVVKIAGNGRITELAGFDEMFSRMAEKMVVTEDEMISKMPPGQCTIDKNIAENHNESQEQLAKRRIDGMNKMYGSREGRIKAIKDMLEKNPSVSKEQAMRILACVVIPFPDSPVQAGDSWTDQVDLKAMMLPVDIESGYTLKEVKDDVFVVSGGFERKMKDPAIDYGVTDSIQGKIKMAGSYQLSSDIDKSSGWLVRSNGKLNISGKINVPSHSEVPQAMQMKINLESTVTVKPMAIAQ